MAKTKHKIDPAVEQELFQKMEEQASKKEQEHKQQDANQPPIKLERPIIFFDIETTGLDIVTCKIVEICTLKILPDFSNSLRKVRLNPEIHIPPEATKIHHITDDDVKGKPTFRQISKSLLEYFHGCDVAGFNQNHYDIPVLAEEFARCGYIFPEENVKSIDVMKMYHKVRPRTLATAAKEFLDVDFVEAHDAQKDVDITARVFLAMIAQEQELKSMTLEELNQLSKRHPMQAETTGKLLYDDKGYLVYNFGRVQGSRVANEPSFAEWIQTKATGFAISIKLLIQRELKKHYKDNKKGQFTKE